MIGGAYASGTIPHALAAHARKFPNRVAVHWEDAALTWEDLLLESQAMAEALSDAGAAAGTMIATWGIAAPFQIVSLCAAGLLEAIQLPLNPRWPGPFLHEIAGNASLVVCDGRLPQLKLTRGPRVLSWSWRMGARPRAPWAAQTTIAANSPVTVNFTRGRYGSPPHGSLLTHAMVLANARSSAQALSLESGDSIAHLFPSWQHPSELIAKALVTECASIVVDFPYPRTVLSLLGRHAPTWVIGSPRVLEGLLPFGDRIVEAFHGVKGVVLVGDYARPRLVSRLTSTKLTVYNAWASAETSGIALVAPASHDSADVCGIPCPGYEASVRSSSGAKEGELLLKGDAVSLRYLDRRPVVGPEGWFATGDLVRITPEGSLRLLGRPGEAVLREGRRVSLAHVESSMARVHGIADAAAVLRPEQEDNVTLFIEPGEGPIAVTAMVRRLRQFFGASLPEIQLVQALPRTMDGRVDKASLVGPEVQSMSLESTDKAILELLNRRAALTRSVRDSEESPLLADETVIQRMVGNNAGPLFDDAVRDVFRCLLDHCRRAS